MSGSRHYLAKVAGSGHYIRILPFIPPKWQDYRDSLAGLLSRLKMAENNRIERSGSSPGTVFNTALLPLRYLPYKYPARAWEKIPSSLNLVANQ